MARIKAQKIPSRNKKLVWYNDVLYRFCHSYPQYKLSEAKKLPYYRVKEMLLVADREHARKMIDMLNIICAPHSKKGTVNKIYKHFGDILGS